MLPVNAMIPLSGKPTVALADPLDQQKKAMAVAAMGQEIEMGRRQAESQNAMRGIFGSPESYDEKGQLRPEAMRSIMAVNPEAGIKIDHAQLQRQAQTSELSIKGQQLIEDKVRAPSAIAFRQAKAAGLSDEAAHDRAQTVYSDGLNDVKGSGLFSDQQIAQMPPQFDFTRVSARSQQYLKWDEEQRKGKMEERKQGETERHNVSSEGIQRGNLGVAQQNVKLRGDELALQRDNALVPKYDKVETVEVKGEDGTHSTVLAQQDNNPRSKTYGQWVSADPSRAPIGTPTRVIHGSVYGEGSKWDDDAIAFKVQDYMLTHKEPTFGGGNIGQENRKLFNNELARVAKSAGMTPADLLAQNAEVKASAMSLGQLTKMADASNAFEATAQKNISTALNLMDKGAGTTAGPIVNRWIQAGRRATGDADVKAFDAAVSTVTNEYAKIMQGSTGAAGATEGARAEAHALVNAADSPQAIRKVFEVMQQDMHNRREALKEERETVKGRIKAASGGPKADAPKSAEPAKPEAKADDGWSVKRVK